MHMYFLGGIFPLSEENGSSFMEGSPFRWTVSVSYTNGEYTRARWCGLVGFKSGRSRLVGKSFGSWKAGEGLALVKDLFQG